MIFLSKMKNPLWIKKNLAIISTNVGLHKSHVAEVNFQRVGIPTVLIYACGHTVKFVFEVFFPYLFSFLDGGAFFSSSLC